MDYLEQLQAELRPMGDQLKEKLSEVDAELARCRAETQALMLAQRRLTSLLRQIEPESVPAKQNGKPRGHDLGAETYKKFTNWLLLHRDQINSGSGIWAGGLMESADFTLMRDRSRINKALSRAHDEGLIVIDSVGRGRRKNYKVVT